MFVCAIAEWLSNRLRIKISKKKSRGKQVGSIRRHPNTNKTELNETARNIFDVIQKIRYNRLILIDEWSEVSFDCVAVRPLEWNFIEREREMHTSVHIAIEIVYTERYQ